MKAHKKLYQVYDLHFWNLTHRAVKNSLYGSFIFRCHIIIFLVIFFSKSLFFNFPDQNYHIWYPFCQYWINIKGWPPVFPKTIDFILAREQVTIENFWKQIRNQHSRFSKTGCPNIKSETPTKRPLRTESDFFETEWILDV